MYLLALSQCFTTPLGCNLDIRVKRVNFKKNCPSIDLDVSELLSRFYWTN